MERERPWHSVQVRDIFVDITCCYFCSIIELYLVNTFRPVREIVVCESMSRAVFILCRVVIDVCFS
jgi:hypothetical protein